LTHDISFKYRNRRNTTNFKLSPFTERRQKYQSYREATRYHGHSQNGEQESAGTCEKKDEKRARGRRG